MTEMTESADRFSASERAELATEAQRNRDFADAVQHHDADSARRALLRAARLERALAASTD